MFNSPTPFSFILYKLQVTKVFLSSSQNYDIIASGVILNPNILRENIALTSPAHRIIIIYKHHRQRAVGRGCTWRVEGFHGVFDISYPSLILTHFKYWLVNKLGRAVLITRHFPVSWHVINHHHSCIVCHVAQTRT